MALGTPSLASLAGGPDPPPTGLARLRPEGRNRPKEGPDVRPWLHPQLPDTQGCSGGPTQSH